MNIQKNQREHLLNVYFKDWDMEAMDMVVMDLEDWDMVDMVLEDMDYGKDLQMLSLTTLLTRDLLMQMQVLDLVLVDLVWVRLG